MLNMRNYEYLSHWTLINNINTSTNIFHLKNRFDYNFQRFKLIIHWFKLE